MRNVEPGGGRRLEVDRLPIRAEIGRRKDGSRGVEADGINRADQRIEMHQQQFTDVGRAPRAARA